MANHTQISESKHHISVSEVGTSERMAQWQRNSKPYAPPNEKLEDKHKANITHLRKTGE
jgi:hypothetical protein